MEDNNSFWQTERGKATIKFGAWFLFIIITFFVFSSPNRNNNNPTDEEDNKKTEEVYTFKNYDDMQKELLTGNFTYDYNIKINEEIFKFTGSKCNMEDVGFKESQEGIIKYSIKDNVVNKVFVDHVEPIENLYEKLEKSFLDLNVLFANLKEYLYSVDKNKDSRTIKYNKEGYQVKVTTNLENITAIEITTDNNKYNLLFTKKDFCDRIAE